jgi:capsular polysaccharide biosynthesis protein
MKIIHIKSGLNIKYNNNETTKEIVFGINNSNNIIQNTTFQLNIEILDPFTFNNIIEKSEKKLIEKGFLFYSYAYEKSFAHYLCQTVPKLYDYINTYSNYKLLIPESRYNNLCKDILKLLNISESQIVILEDGIIYDILDYIITPIYHAIPSYMTSNQLSIFKKIRDNLEIKQNLNPRRNIYIKRDGIPNDNFGNSETGILRQIKNENELIDSLRIKGFEIISLGDKHIIENIILLNDINICITPLGANMLNFIFSNAPKKIICLSNHNNFGFEQYISTIDNLNNCKTNHNLLRYNSISIDPLNQWNGSFNVNIKDIIKTIDDDNKNI